jgi:hypothetical protein
MFKRIQGFIIGFMTCAILFGGVALAAEELRVVPNTIPIFANSEPADISAYNINGYTFAKYADMVRIINKILGAEILSLKFDEVKGIINLDADKSLITTQSMAEVNAVSGINQEIQYDQVTGLPVGAVYIDNEKDGKKYKTIQYNSKIYISTSDLRSLFGIKYVRMIDNYTKSLFEKDGIQITVNKIPNVSSFTVGAYVYEDIAPFEDYLGK